jgi:hypothetical protein
MREAGRRYGQLRRAADDLRRAFTLEADRMDAAERYKELQERRRKVQEARKKADEERQAATGTVAQEVTPAEAPPVVAPVEGEAGPTPNDLPPDMPAAHKRTGTGSP